MTFFERLEQLYAAARRDHPRRTWLYYAEWDELFAICERPDGGYPAFLKPALDTLRTAMREARENAVPELIFWRDWNANCERTRPVYQAPRAIIRDDLRSRKAQRRAESEEFAL